MTDNELVKTKLDDYLGFDSSKLFIPDMVRVFGGAVRDIIAGLPINDVDILCGSKSADLLDNILTKNGFVFIESLAPKDLASVYNDIQIICEPHTYVKGDRVIQVIRPRQHPDGYRGSFDFLISNVDLSCCGVSWNGREIIESVKDAVSHCRMRRFKEVKFAKMKHERRLMHRKYKLIDRGWEEIHSDSDNRNAKLDYYLEDGII